MKILNAFYHDMEESRRFAITKEKTNEHIRKRFKANFRNSLFSKVSEEFIVEIPYGAIPNSSTTMALISMLHHWFANTDGNGTTIRTILFDYREAFDFNSVGNLGIPRSIVNWAYLEG